MITNDKALVCGVFTLTPTHPGTGQAAETIDLPIARETHTKLPVLPASSLKGVMRELATSMSNKDKIISKLFGPLPQDTPEASDSDNGKSDDTYQGAGNLIFFNGMLLAFPVRSVTNIYHFVTAPILINNFKRIAEALGMKINIVCPNPDELGNKSKESIIVSERNGSVNLEDLVFSETETMEDSGFEKTAEFLAKFLPVGERENFKKRLVIVSDRILKDLTNRATAVTARTVLDKDTKTSNNLWYEETLPSETLFAIIIGNRPSLNNKNCVEDKTCTDVLRDIFANKNEDIYTYIGGNTTVGQGLVQLTVLDNG